MKIRDILNYYKAYDREGCTGGSALINIKLDHRFTITVIADEVQEMNKDQEILLILSYTIPGTYIVCSASSKFLEGSYPDLSEVTISLAKSVNERIQDSLDRMDKESMQDMQDLRHLL